MKKGSAMESDAAFAEWLLVRTWSQTISFCRVIAFLVPVIALAIDIPVVLHHEWTTHAAWGWLIAWHVATEMWCVGYLCLDRFATHLRGSAFAVVLFGIMTLVLSTWFGLISWIFYGDFSMYAVGSVLTSTILCTPTPVRRPVYFLSALVIVGFVLWQSPLQIGALFPVVINPIAVAIICYQLDRYTSAQNRALFQENLRAESERQRADRVLYNVFPVAIADELKRDQKVAAVKFDNMGVLFADIVGFTSFSRALPADALVFILNQIFTSFDTALERFNLEKIKTIGDAYMAISTVNTAHLARFALEMVAVLQSYNRANGTDFQIRIGLHVGPAVAGVIGVKRFLYDVWGDTVNVASRMESSGEAGRVHVSESIRSELQEEFAFERRSVIDVKGRGPMQTYFLFGAKPKN
jgi:class 3 adenylate cyclase